MMTNAISYVGTIHALLDRTPTAGPDYLRVSLLQALAICGYPRVATSHSSDCLIESLVAVAIEIILGATRRH